MADLDYVQPSGSTLSYGGAGSGAFGLHAARRLLLNGISPNCLSGVASCHDLLHGPSATYKTLSATQPEGCLMTTDDNQELRQLLGMAAAVISSMDAARRGHTETDPHGLGFVQGLCHTIYGYHQPAAPGLSLAGDLETIQHGQYAGTTKAHVPRTRDQSSRTFTQTCRSCGLSSKTSSGLPATRDEPLLTFSNPGCGPQ